MTLEAGCGRRRKSAGGEPAGRPDESGRGTQSACATSFAPDGLDVDEFADAEDAQLAAVAGTLHTAEGQPGIGGHHAVYKNRARLDFVDEPRLLGGVARPDARPETERRIVRKFDGFRDVLDAEKHGHRDDKIGR